MNVERLEQLAKRLEGLEPDQFNINRIRFPDGKPSCIAGHALALFGEGTNEKVLLLFYDENGAQKVLGLTADEADALFIPWWRGRNPKAIGPKDAAAAIRALIGGTPPDDIWKQP